MKHDRILRARPNNQPISFGSNHEVSTGFKLELTLVSHSRSVSQAHTTEQIRATQTHLSASHTRNMRAVCAVNSSCLIRSLQRKWIVTRTNLRKKLWCKLGLISFLIRFGHRIHLFFVSNLIRTARTEKPNQSGRWPRASHRLAKASKWPQARYVPCQFKVV